MLLYYILGLGLQLVWAETNTSTEESREEVDSYYPNQVWSDTFDWKLLKVFSPRHKNVLISPISLKIVLALLYEGSSGSTEREFQNVLQFPEKAKLRENYKQIIQNLQPIQRTEYLLNMGTRIFLDSNIQPKQLYAAKASEYYQTDIEPTHFSNSLNASQAVNSWIEKLTNGKIAQLVKPDDIQNAIMLITNAVYFKGTWTHQFPKNQTYFGKFHVTTTTAIDIPYMSTTDEFYFHESTSLEATILRLPYKGKRYSMFIVLPYSTGGLPELIRTISLRELHEQLYYLDKQLVQVSIPKFKFNFQASLSHVLQEFGLRQMFQNTASFPGITRGNNTLLRMLVVSDIIQKSGIELDEEGSVVYAATDITIGNKFGSPNFVFNATHPFLFFIEEVTTGTILFVGKVENPLEYEAVPLSSLENEYSTLQPEPSTTKSPVVENESQFIPSNQNTVLNLEGDQNYYPQINFQINNEENVINRFNFFDVELLSEFADTEQNILLSPASIKITLAMILEGAKGLCAQEISEALRIPNIKQNEIRQILANLLNNVNERSQNSYIEAANAVFVDEKLKLLPEYRSLAESFYRSFIKNLDFSKISSAIDTINNWVSNATHGAITDLVGPQTISGETDVVLTNALYFKGLWQNAFDVKNTRIKCFKTNQRGCINTPMMRIADNFNYNYIGRLSAYVVEIPYQGKFSMLILLPSEDTNVRSLIRDLQHFKFNDILDNLKITDITLEIPKFSFEYSADLVEYLKVLKIKEIFGPAANLTGIIKNGNIKVNNIVHKTKIEVDELGTVAAAATGAVVVPLIGSTTVIMDRPFVFFIYHKDTRNIIFEGIFAQPLSSEPNRPSALLQQNYPKYFGNNIYSQQNGYRRG